MTAETMPPLPESFEFTSAETGEFRCRIFSAQQVHAYAREYAAQQDALRQEELAELHFANEALERRLQQAVAAEQQRVAALATFAHEIWLDAYERPDLAAEGVLRKVKLLSMDWVVDLQRKADEGRSQA